MDSLPLHPVVVHIPIALSVLMPFIAVGVIVAWWKDAIPRKAWLIVVALFGVLFLGGLGAMNTGETDEEKVERVVAETHIEEHEEAAEVFVWGAGVLFALSLLGLVLPGEKTRRWTAVATAISSLALLYLGYEVGHAGGRLVYEHGAASAHTSTQASNPTTDTDGQDLVRYEEQDEDDD